MKEYSRKLKALLRTFQFHSILGKIYVEKSTTELPFTQIIKNRRANPLTNLQNNLSTLIKYLEMHRTCGRTDKTRPLYFLNIQPDIGYDCRKSCQL